MLKQGAIQMGIRQMRAPGNSRLPGTDWSEDAVRGRAASLPQLPPGCFTSAGGFPKCPRLTKQNKKNSKAKLQALLLKLGGGRCCLKRLKVLFTLTDNKSCGK